jgi:hypothetical protein
MVSAIASKFREALGYRINQRGSLGALTYTKVSTDTNVLSLCCRASSLIATVFVFSHPFKSDMCNT